MNECKCDMRTKLVGDGCSVCNPERYEPDDLISRLNEPEQHYPANFDTPKRANAILSSLCQEAADEIKRLQAELAALKSQEPVAWANKDGTMFCGNWEKFKHKAFTVPLYFHPTTTDRDAWQPIETAPNDGTAILVYTQHDNFYVVSYDDVFSAPWRVRNDAGLNERALTHWMPLPAPPTMQEGK